MEKRTEKEKELDDNIVNHPETSQSLTFKIPRNLERKNVAYYSILFDLETCKKSLLELIKENNETLKTSLFTSTIILYGKCFTDGSSTKSPKLELDCFKNFEKLKELHLKLMDMRHNFVAHRGKTEHEYGKAYFQFFPRTMKWGIKVGLRRRFNFEENEIPEYLELVNHLIEITLKKYKKTANKVMEHIVTNYSEPSPENEMELINDVDSELKDYVMSLKIEKE